MEKNIIKEFLKFVDNHSSTMDEEYDKSFTIRDLEEYIPYFSEELEKMDFRYKVEAVYLKIFKVKKFKNYIRDGKKQEIIEYLEHQGNHYLGCGWSEQNSTIIDVRPKGVRFNHDERIYSFETIADKLIEMYSKDAKGGK